MRRPLPGVWALGLMLGAAAAPLAAQAAEEVAGELDRCPAAARSEHPDELVVQGFPSARGARLETAWCVRWEDAGRKGLRIGEAWFKRRASEEWMQVLGRAGLVEVFVPYHSGRPDLRFLDLQSKRLKPLHPADAGRFGVLLGSPAKVVVREVRDRGVAWTSDHQLRRGEELRLWGVYDADNYEYVIQYGFWDSGHVTFRLGSTGYNNPHVLREAHMHTALWRVDLDLDGPDGDLAAFVEHTERDATGPTHFATDTELVLAEEWQGRWDPEAFSAVRIADAQRRNANGHAIAYELVPVRTGSSRHVEPFSQQDFRVTLFHEDEADPEASEVPELVDGEALAAGNVVLWHTSASHHDPHDEDGLFALVRESGFDLVPRNLFDTTPLVDTGCPSSRLAGSLLQGWEIVKASSFATGPVTVSAPCPSGKSLLGGGARIVHVPNGTGLTGSFPASPPGAPGWLAEARPIVPGDAAPWRLESYAICARVSGRQVESAVRLRGENPFLPLAANCPYGKAVLGGGGRSRHPRAGLTTTAPAGPVCPARWEADARKVPRIDDPSTTDSASVICGNVPGYEVVAAASAKDSIGLKNATARCPAGKVVVGGGATIVGDATNTVLRMSWPRSLERSGDGWSAQAAELRLNPADWQLQVTAICACYPGPCG
ncbi:MAG TPA: hypothetical protein VF121_10545 [Thermoanaerobaculia bacterium]|nr:hypothetical protein [Thermoanaerobaculia bacterium]